ncbi:MAG TPA: PadR family transcriptional regulator [Actinomycetota bacterium]|jgi:DNA-binding PadR family transcriptional regulator|nr:PadR family transcriptional regulator [Actinomycetota bacterium]
MSIALSLLTLLDQSPSFGLRMKQEFERRTGGVWPLNVGQVYTTLDRLEREGLVRQLDEGGVDRQRLHEITDAGRERLAEWFHRPADRSPGRDPLVLKLVMAAHDSGVDTAEVIQAERRGAVEQLQQYTRLKREAPGEDDLGWAFLVDSLIFNTEARVRWLDVCEARLSKSRVGAAPADAAFDADTEAPEEVLR